MLVLGIDFVNNIGWWQKQMSIEGSWVESVKSISTTLFGSFKIGTELLIYNGIFTFLGLYLISKPQPVSPEVKEILGYGHC